MAKYAYDTLEFVGELFKFNIEERIIYTLRPMTALRFHREVSEIFDEVDWMSFEPPTMRLTDDHIQVHSAWTVGNPELITAGILEQL